MSLNESLQRQLEECNLLFLNAGGDIHVNVKTTFPLFIKNLGDCLRTNVKRCKERNLEEASKLLKKISKNLLESLEIKYMLPLTQLIISMQLETLQVSTVFRKLDQMMQHFSEINHSLVFEEVQKCLKAVMDSEQMLEAKALQTVGMFLEDSTVGREVLRQAFPSLLHKVDQAFYSIMEQELLRNGDACYNAVKVCLQMFQLLPEEVTPLVWKDGGAVSPLPDILKYLMDIILGESSCRDTRLLAGTAMVMLINTSPTAEGGATAAWSMLEVTCQELQELRVGELRVQCRPGQDCVGRLAVSRGLLSCCRKDVLLWGRGGKERCLLLEGLFPIVSALCEKSFDCHYYVFQVLVLWLRQVKECLMGLWDLKSAPLLLEDSILCRQLVQVVWNIAESPVEGVSESVHCSFRLLLEILDLERRRFPETEMRLYSSLLSFVGALPWEAKAKYFPLCALLPYVGSGVVFERFPDLPRDLLKCLSTNHLSPSASETYKSLIQQQRRELCAAVAPGSSPSELELAEMWAQRWQPALLEALTSDIMLLQSNASSHLLPWTLRTFPGAFEILQASLSGASTGHLRAWACLVCNWRAMGRSWSLEEGLSQETLQLALGSLDDSVRLAALGLLCGGPGTRHLPSALEVATLKQFIPLNLNSESSPFRQQLQAMVKKLLVRIRDGCLACLRKERKGGGRDIGQEMETDSLLKQGVDLVDWLARLAFTSVAPGLSYQRKKTALLFLSAVLETCTDTWSPDKKKGQPPANMSALITWARCRGLWDFFSMSNLLVLITCLEDSTNEIREMASELILKFFPLGLPEELSRALLKRAQVLLCSPRVQEAQTGALLTKVLLQKSQDISMVLQEGFHQADGSRSSQEVKTAAMVQYLLGELDLHYLTARTDMLLAARTRPIHGILSALQRCLLESPRAPLPLQGAALSQNVMATILSLLEKITHLLLGILYGDKADCTEEEEAPPSFCAMGNAIRTVIAQGGGQEGEGQGEECVLLSEEHSLVLTCCWVSFKEIGIFLGGLVEMVLVESRGGECPLSTEDLKRVAKIFRDILLKCRHWGAVEGCCCGLTRFCATLLGSSDTELQPIPGLLLEQVLAVLQGRSATSVTRRAAGLPMLVLCILSAEEAGKARPLLAHTMQVLLETAGRPVSDNWDQTLDLPQVGAVHTLQALVRGSGLGVAIFQFASSVAILSLTLLSSPCWAMRNAALQLYNALCSRMLGQRPSSDDGLVHHGMSPPAFFTHYPALQPFLLGELQGAASELLGASGEARLHLHPSLFPVLTLLAKLQPGVQDRTQSLSDFQMPLLQLAGSPMYHVRVMACRALVAMTPPVEHMNTLLGLARQLPDPDDPCCHNRLHGQLLQMSALLGRAAVSDNLKVLYQVVELFESKWWLVTSTQRCPLIRLTYLQVLHHLREFCSPGFSEQLQAELLLQLLSPTQEQLVGSSSFLQNAARFLFEETVRLGDMRSVAELCENFPEEGTDVQLALVRWILEDQRWRGTSMHQVLQTVLQANLKAALLSGNVEYRKTYLAALLATLTPADPLTLQRPASLQGAELLLEVLESGAGGPELLSQALAALSLLLDISSESPLTDRWCRQLEKYRVPEAPEVLRLACAQAVRLAGPSLLCSCVGGGSSSSALSVRLISTGLHLLNDEDQRVRAEAACFASAVGQLRAGQPGESCVQVQATRGLLLLLNLLLEELWDGPETLETLLLHLPELELGAVLSSMRGSGHCSLYEQDEANVFAEPAAMSELLLPYLLRLADRYPQCSSLRVSMALWVRENTGPVLENVSLCKQLNPADSGSWLRLLAEPRFHGALCGLFVRAGFLLRLLDTCEDLRPLCDPCDLRTDFRIAHGLLRRGGVLLPAGIPLALGLE
ncbi:thyroid adenoma-associated protein homolog [Brienomyrus brachyistius]|uniref:thyroid adenoma-associated protein homolog n=1 Tax=Brienomyrus brachyistius TaxID=42636 RepID=UPI0020B29173|nr:thyroid adenoma-associated protein homolog [Brienomyrus brachyistius]